jgi:chaperone required for assembly of F1-ATPase
VRTATKEILTLPLHKVALASGIALEWDLLVSAQQALKYHYIPLTSLSSRAMDIQKAETRGDRSIRESIIKVMMRYLGTDTLLCWDPEKNVHDMGLDMKREGSSKKTLRQKQVETAESILAHLTTHIFPGLEIVPILGEESIMPIAQPQETQDVIRAWMSSLCAFDLAGLERGVLATKSLLVAIRLVVEWSQELGHAQRLSNSSDCRFGISEASEASRVEVTWQTDMWGEVEDSHDVDKEDVARQLGSVILLVS